MWVILIAIIIVAAFLIAYHCYPTYRESLIFYATTLGATTAVVGLIITGIQLNNSARHDRQAVAFAFHDKWKDLPLLKIEMTFKNLDGKNEKEVREFLQANQTDEEAVIELFNFFEEIGIAVKYQYADETISCRFYEEAATRYFSLLADYLTWYRMKANRTGLYENYEWLAKKWRDDGCPSES
jgi:hypothetical protein